MKKLFEVKHGIGNTTKVVANDMKTVINTYDAKSIEEIEPKVIVLRDPNMPETFTKEDVVQLLTKLGASNPEMFHKYSGDDDMGKGAYGEMFDRYIKK